MHYRASVKRNHSISSPYTADNPTTQCTKQLEADILFTDGASAKKPNIDIHRFQVYTVTIELSFLE
jgi:hypothetical protein